jgi:hypothetical protein
MDTFQQLKQIYLKFSNDMEQNLLQYPKNENIKMIIKRMLLFLLNLLTYNK